MTRISYDDFEIGESIGMGTVGEIYRVTRKATGDVYALKLLHPSLGQDPLIVRRFRREMMVLSKLNHPNIVGLNDVFYNGVTRYGRDVSVWGSRNVGGNSWE